MARPPLLRKEGNLLLSKPPLPSHFELSVHIQVECRPILIREAHVAGRALARRPAEQDELRCISAAVDQMRKELFSAGCGCELIAGRSRRDQEIGALTVAAAQPDHRDTR